MITPSTSRASKYLEGFEATGYGSTAGGGTRKTSPQQLDTWAYGSPGDIRRAKFSGGGGGGGRSRGSTGSTTTSQTIRKGAAPELPELPTYKAPQVDKRKIRALTQKLAGPGVRTLRQTMQQAMGRTYENPNVRKLTLREALKGYGTGLEKVMAGAGREARSEHMAELDLQRQQEMMNFQAQTKAAMASYQNAWADYLKGEKTVSTTTPTTAEGTQTGGTQMGGRTYYYRRNPFTGQVQPI